MPPSTRRSKATTATENETHKTPSKPLVERETRSTTKAKRLARDDAISAVEETPALRIGAKDPKKRVRFSEAVNLARKMEQQSHRLQRERLGAAKLTEVPVTSLSLMNHGPFSLALPRSPTPEPTFVARSFKEQNERMVIEMLKATPTPILGKLRVTVHGYIYAGKQLAVFMAYVVCWMLSFGTLQFEGVWKRWAYQYPPTPNGWDLFGIRTWIAENVRQRNPIEVKKCVWWNPDTGRYEAVTYSRLNDPGIYRDRWPGETDGIDPEEFGKYHYLSTEEVLVKWLGERIVKPLMQVFQFSVMVWAFSFAGIVIISVGHMYLVEFLEWLADIVEKQPEMEQRAWNAWENISSLAGKIWDLYLPAVVMRVLERLIGT
ncbi:hypothetical protein ABW21_db0208554 [Orbilia brochopaga]|nr:hypothetical protein ABW21_db0208554 [Drechslerella brochopaga]